MTKVLNFALKIKGGGREGGACEVLRPCHPPPPKFGTCTKGFLETRLTFEVPASFIPLLFSVVICVRLPVFRGKTRVWEGRKIYLIFRLVYVIF